MSEEITMTIDDRERNIDLSLSQDTQIDLNIETSGGTNDYNKLIHKPQINDIELVGNLSLDELGIQEEGNYPDTRVTNIEIDNLF